MKAALLEVDFISNNFCEKDLNNDDIYTNVCYQYAVARHHFYTHSKAVELFVTYEPQFTQIGEWLKQLFGESEGKDKKGLLPDSVTFSTDLHSLGQFIQQGSPVFSVNLKDFVWKTYRHIFHSHPVPENHDDAL